MSFTVIALEGNVGLAGTVQTEAEIPGALADLRNLVAVHVRNYWRWDRELTEGATPRWPEAHRRHRIPVLAFARREEPPTEVDYDTVPAWVQSEAAKVLGVKEVIRSRSDNSPNGDGYIYKAQTSYEVGGAWFNENQYINNPDAEKPGVRAPAKSSPDDQPF